MFELNGHKPRGSDQNLHKSVFQMQRYIVDFRTRITLYNPRLLKWYLYRANSFLVRVLFGFFCLTINRSSSCIKIDKNFELFFYLFTHFMFLFYFIVIV